MPYLALIMFIPSFLLFGVLYWNYPRTPRTAMRHIYDAATLLLAGVGSFTGMRWAWLHASTVGGQEWRQMFATLISYAVFIGVMAIALMVRTRWMRR